MSTLTFAMVETEEKRLGITISENHKVTGLLLIALLESREAVVYINNDVLYIYAASDAACYASQTEQLDNFLRYEEKRHVIDIVARGRVNLTYNGDTIHVSLDTTLLASIYQSDVKSLLIVDRTNNGVIKQYGVDVYDPMILDMVGRVGNKSIKTLVLALNEVLKTNENNLSDSRILH